MVLGAGDGHGQDLPRSDCGQFGIGAGKAAGAGAEGAGTGAGREAIWPAQLT
jgi:hypothetical protein